MTATNFTGSVVTAAPASASARPGLTPPEAEIDGPKRRILLEQTLGADITKLNHWTGALDDDETDALDDALRLQAGPPMQTRRLQVPSS